MFKKLLTREGAFLRVMGLQIGNNAMVVCWSFLFQLIVDTAMGKTRWDFGSLTLFILGYLMVMDLFYTADHYQTNLLKIRTTATLRDQVIEKTATLSPAEFGKLGVGGVIAKLTKQLDKIETEYYGEILGLSRAAFQFVFSVVATLVINPMVTLVALGLSIPSLVLPYLTKKAIANASAAQVAEIERYTKRITDLLGGFTTLKYALAPAALIGQHYQANCKMLAAQQKNEKINQITSGLAVFFNDVMTLMIWVVGAMLVRRGQMGMGQLVAFANLTGFMSWPLAQLTQSIPTIIGGGKAASLIGAYLDEPVKETGDAPALTPQVQINAKKLGLTIANHEILADVDLTLDQHCKYLLVGASGSGKSTLVRLLLGEVSPTAGTLTLLGQAPTALSRTDVYRRIGLMAQKGYVFDGTVRDNMTLFSGGFDDAAITTALKRAGLADWLAQHSLDTVVSEAGAELSGGEKQRLALARLFLRGYDFFVFDELTTGLDPHIADQLQKDICAMPQGFLMITHTYNQEAFAHVDEILVMKDGRISARGSVGKPAVQRALHELAMI